MTELLTAAQMRAIEQAAIDSGEVTGLELMERAGQGVVDAIFEEWPDLRKKNHRAVVLCGPGNNGGDGFVVARLLKEADWQVEVFLYGDAEKLPPDAKVNFQRWTTLDVVGAMAEAPVSLMPQKGSCAPILIDALFGTGLVRPLPPQVEACLKQAQFLNDGRRIVSVDLPSGICSDSGRVLRYPSADHDRMPMLNEAVTPHLTVCFGWKKLGCVLSHGSMDCGKVYLSPLGIEISETTSEYLLKHFDGVVRLISGRSLSALSKPHIDAHKYSHGHALILSGGVGKGGAARLAARGAIRIGAGAVTVGGPPAALIENAAQLNAIMLRGVKDADSLTETLQDTRMNALCLGPGLGTGAREVKLLDAALEKTRPGLNPGTQPEAKRRGPGSGPGRSLVLDADALTLIAQDETLFTKLHKNCILTPHAGEFARLFPDIAEKLNAPATKGPAYSKVDATREAAKRAGCVVLFKGPDTVIADPSGRCSINASVYERSAPWLATAGSGDVLAGFITGLLARGLLPMQAAETGAWLHTECALSFGPGLIAEDLPEELPKVFRALRL